MWTLARDCPPSATCLSPARPYTASVWTICSVRPPLGLLRVAPAQASVATLQFPAGGVGPSVPNARAPRVPAMSRERVALVPSAAQSRERERGSNQTAVIAQSSRGSDIPVWDYVLTRTRPLSRRRSDAGGKTDNVAGALRVRENARDKLRGGHLFSSTYCDDSCNLNACAAALFDAGSRIIAMDIRRAATAVTGFHHRTGIQNGHSFGIKGSAYRTRSSCRQR